MRAYLLACFVFLVLFVACAKKSEPQLSLSYTEEREPCSDGNFYRNLYFGDLHAHTGLSFDAWAYGNHATPDDVYDFARGQALAISPVEGQDGERVVQLSRPLDFAAVTDHHEYLGEIELCVSPGSPVYDSPACVSYRRGDVSDVVDFGVRMTKPDPRRSDDLCLPNPEGCLEVAQEVWARVQKAAEDAYDRTSACSFTSFVAYEYTNSIAATNLHRNVIFRNAEVPDLPPSYFEYPDPMDLLRDLRANCIEAGSGCDVISIPHNSNWSNGQLFDPGTESLELARERAALRAQMEPLVEIFQHKGDMECDATLDSGGNHNDPLCDFEKERFGPHADCGDVPGAGGVSLLGCVSKHDFVRNVLKTGLAEEARLGINPFRLGIIGSTDTHNATAGFVDERQFEGHVGTTDDTVEKRLGPGNMTHHGVRHGPGGLAAVWAVENSRDALFEAFRRREVYGTSGPRIEVRFFAGWDFPDNLCERKDRVELGYGQGVPMGGTLEAGPAGDAPTFAVWAQADVGAKLQRIQVVKGWLDEAGRLREKVFEVAGAADIGAVNLDSCETDGAGSEQLCAVWSDPAFDPTQPAFYYARVLEVPTCRWSVRQCHTLAADQRPESCSDPRFYRAIQERAWTSPVWLR